jgi:hypothetical protein
MLYGTGMLLLAAIGGYWVLERAETHKGNLRKVGRLLGGAIIVLSLLGLFFRCGMGSSQAGGKWMCPFSGKPTSPSPQ